MSRTAAILATLVVVASSSLSAQVVADATARDVAPREVRVPNAPSANLAASPAPVSDSTAPALKDPLVEFELMTWAEVKAAIDGGKTTALFYTGGTEQRGPQNANGGHNMMARATVRAIALKLGNAIAMPVLPYTPNNASATLPGTIGLTNEILAAVLERIAEQAVASGFRNVILMGDHGGGQPNVYADVAKRLDEKYAPQGMHVYYCDETYAKAQGDFNKWLAEHGYPSGGHAAISDTSEMWYLGGDEWVRPALMKTALGDPVREPGSPPPAAGTPRLNNGITGDARRSSKELGKMQFDLKVEYAVKQIRGFLGSN
jgi:creatinine amidohydrolase/Fe(II)-dependent formamide hydrolase-like protein